MRIKSRHPAERKWVGYRSLLFMVTIFCGIAHFALIKFCACAACASGVALLFHAHARALVRQWYAHKKPHSLHALRVPFTH